MFGLLNDSDIYNIILYRFKNYEILNKVILVGINIVI